MNLENFFGLKMENKKLIKRNRALNQIPSTLVLSKQECIGDSGLKSFSEIITFIIAHATSDYSLDKLCIKKCLQTEYVKIQHQQ